MINFIDCIVCKEYTDKGKCNAFPNGIPDSILFGKISHRINVDNDNGIKFSPLKQFKGLN